MINFNFTLDDIDASNFADILQKNIRERTMHIDFYGVGEREHIHNDAELKWHKGHLKYLEAMYATIMKGQTRLKG